MCFAKLFYFSFIANCAFFLKIKHYTQVASDLKLIECIRNIISRKNVFMGYDEEFGGKISTFFKRKV